MSKKFLTAWVVVLIAWFLGSFIIHGVLLNADYLRLGALFRTPADSQRYFPFMIVAHVSFSGAFAWIYGRGVEAKPWLGQGLRFGLAMACLSSLPIYLIYFAVQPMPAGIVARQIVYETILLLILGALVAWVYRDGKRA